jgi:hypothetical protein
MRRRRGRPRQAQARRRATTLAGRRAPDDLGTEQLRRRKVRATSRPDLEISGAGVLLGRDLIDIEQYTVLMTITMWLERLMRGWAGVGGVTGLWHSITGAAVPTGFVRPPNDVSSGLADGARRQLVRALQRHVAVLAVALLRIGVNLNQIARHMNAGRGRAGAGLGEGCTDAD